MTWYAVFAAGTSPSTSNPVSTGTIIDTAALTAAGMTYITLPGDPTGLVWQQSSQSFVAPAVTITLSAVQFMDLFTLTERTAIRTSTDPVVMDFVWRANNSVVVSLSDPVVINGLTYLSANPSGSPILASGRSATILAGTPSGS
jgi:hypothetical protein